MRKLFLLASLMIICLSVSAQGLKGVWFAGGNVNFGKQEINVPAGVEKVTQTAVMPLVGKFISPSVAIGGALGYSQVKHDDLKSNTYTIMPLARKYWNIAGNLYVFGQMALPVDISNTKNSNPNSDGFGIHFQVAPGFDLIVNSWFSIEASFVLVNAGYSQQKPKSGDTTRDWSLKGNTIGSSSFGDLSVGVKFLF